MPRTLGAKVVPLAAVAALYISPPQTFGAGLRPLWPSGGCEDEVEVWKTGEDFTKYLDKVFVGRHELKETLLDTFTWAEDLKKRRAKDKSIPMTPMHTVAA